MKSMNHDGIDWSRCAWIAGSVLVNLTIGMYIWLSTNAPSEFAARHAYLNENWTLYALHWKAEFVFMALIAVGAFSFAVRTRVSGWSFVFVGQLLLLSTYPVMLGGYRDTAPEIAEMMNQVSLVIFLFGNLLFLAGLVLVYLRASEIRPILRGFALVLALICTMVFAACFLNFISWSQAALAGPLVMMLYLINAWYGLKVDLD